MNTPNQHSSTTRAARSWLESERSTRSLPTTSAVADVLPFPDRPPVVLPELDLFHAAAIERLGQDIVHADRGDLDLIADRADLVDLAVTDQLAARGFGEVFTFLQQCDADLVQNLMPRIGREEENSNAGRKRLDAHVDDALLAGRYRADSLVIIGLANEDLVATDLIPVDRLLQLLDPRVVAHLREPRFTFACPEAFAVGDLSSVRSPALPILGSGPLGATIRFASFSTAVVEGDLQAARALEALRDAVDAVQRLSLVLGPGDIVMFSNERFLHARGPVGGRRWMKRVYLKQDLSALRADCATTDPNVFDLEPAITASLRLEGGR